MKVREQDLFRIAGVTAAAALDQQVQPDRGGDEEEQNDQDESAHQRLLPRMLSAAVFASASDSLTIFSRATVTSLWSFASAVATISRA